MTINGKAYIAGIYEHPTRKAHDKSLAQLHAEVAKGALDDAGLTKNDVDGYFCAGDAPGSGRSRWSTTWASSCATSTRPRRAARPTCCTCGHAAEAIAAGKCNVALITLAGRPRAEGMATGTAPRNYGAAAPDVQFEYPFGPTVANMYAMCAMRHMHEYGTTSEQLAWVKVAASHHAQHNPHAMLRDVVTVEDVVNSPMIADPLHRLDCCVISDGGGALVVVQPGDRQEPEASAGEDPRRRRGAQAPDGRQGRSDLLRRRLVGTAAFAEAGVKPADIKYVSIYDSFTITVLMQLEDLGFCEKGQGGKFVADGNLISGTGKLPFNTDGGGLCNNHPANRGGMTKVIEAVRQLRGEAHPKVQVKNCDLALAHGTGGSLGTRHAQRHRHHGKGVSDGRHRAARFRPRPRIPRRSPSGTRRPRASS